MKKFLIAIFSFTPMFALAFPSDFKGFVDQIVDLIYTAIPIIASIALLIFFWGLARFILNAGDAKGKIEGKMFMTWGLVGLFVMVSFWGIIRFAYNDFGFTRPFGVPTLPAGTKINQQ